MAHHSLYFTRGTPRSTNPAFTLDLSKKALLEAQAERFRQQYTYGVAGPPHEVVAEQSEKLVKHGHTKSRRSEVGWVPASEIEEQPTLVKPTFSKPKPTDIPLANTPSSNSSAPTSLTQRAPLQQSSSLATNAAPSQNVSAPVKTAIPPVGTTIPAKATTGITDTSAVRKTTATPLSVSTSAKITASSLSSVASTTHPVPSRQPPVGVNASNTPLATPQGGPPISHAESVSPFSKIVKLSLLSDRQGDLRRSVALSNATKSQSVKTQVATQVASQASEPLTTSTTTVEMPETQSPRSSPDYRPSSPSSRSSRSSTPKPPAVVVASPSRRRSGRSRAEPVTYNLKALTRRQVGTIDSPHHSEGEDFLAASESPPPRASPRPSVQSRPSLPPRQSSQPRGMLHDFSAEIQTERGPRRKANLSKLLWTRELQGPRHSHNLVQATLSSNLKPWKSWKGASNDVSTLTWSPDGTKFAAGATALSDQYNRRNNLLFGDLSLNNLYELPDHNIPRKGDAATADECLYPTVSSVQWVGNQLYTASYDQTVKIWTTNLLTSAGTPICARTLRHDSNVMVMSVSNLMPHLVATGTARSFSLWNLLNRGQGPQALEIKRDPRQKANIILEPTVLGWGQSAATMEYLVGGMAENVPNLDDDEKKKFEVAQHGHLGLWRVTQSSVEICKLRGSDSQNVFDVKWHPSLRRFAIASTYSQAMNLPLRSKSAVLLYEMESNDRAVVVGKCACSARDINEVTFCPMDSTYITASCTDGSTYVWDTRSDARPVHKLHHGLSVNSLNQQVSRELTDLGVRVALWGTTMDQFYTGASDGYLKQWDIRRATEDALVANRAHISDGIVSGAFSADKSQLLLGDYGGGIHVLSCEQAERESADFNFKPAPEPPSHEEPGVPIANELLSSGKLILHPVFGPVQGPQYNGPYAPWARGLPKTATRDKVKRTPLLSQYQLRQFDGPPLDERHQLDAESRRDLQCNFNLARARHARRARPTGVVSANENIRKRKRDGRVDFGGIEKDAHTSSSSPTRKKKQKKKDKSKDLWRNSHVITKIEESVIDLTIESDSESVSIPSTSAPASVPVDTTPVDLTVDTVERPEPTHDRQFSLSPVPRVLDEDSDEDDYWWPDSRLVDANLNSDNL